MVVVQEDALPESILSVLDSEVTAEPWVDPKLQKQRQADQAAAAASAAAFQQVTCLAICCKCPCNSRRHETRCLR